jgi:hypothetical protein
MMKKWGLAIFAVVLAFTACKNDDDFKEPSIADQNKWDDDAILAYLEDHYFEPELGLIKRFDATDSTDDAYPTLLSQGTKLPSGVWVVKKNDYEAEGRAVVNNAQDSILLSYEAKIFKADYDNLADGQKPYTNEFGTLFSTINGSGSPQWDPNFYHVHLTTTMLNNGIKPSYYEIEGFIEGLKHFKSTDTNGTEAFSFQGAIIVPSRAAYSRDVSYISGSPSYNFRNTSFIFNFELHKVIDRSN